MGLLSNLKSDDKINNQTDSVGGGGPLESGLYPMTIETAYVRISAGGATGIVVTLKTDQGREHKETLWAASGDAKGNKNYYENQQGERNYLPGYIHANNLVMLTLDKEIDELETEKKTIKLYNFDAGKEVNTEVDMLTDLIGQRVIIGLQKQIVDKNVKDASGAYVASGETREVNEIDKVFHEDTKMTVAELMAKADEPAFYHTWDKKWTGVTRNKASAANDANGASGAPQPKAAAAGGGTAKPTKSLFGGKTA